MEKAYELLFGGSLIVVILLIVPCLVRAIRGPRVADRVVAINMMTTLTTVAIAILTVMKAEGYLADITLIFSLLGFLAVVLLSKIYTGIYLKRKEDEEHGA